MVRTTRVHPTSSSARRESKRRRGVSGGGRTGRCVDAARPPPDGLPRRRLFTGGLVTPRGGVGGEGRGGGVTRRDARVGGRRSRGRRAPTLHCLLQTFRPGGSRERDGGGGASGGEGRRRGRSSFLPKLFPARLRAFFSKLRRRKKIPRLRHRNSRDQDPLLSFPASRPASLSKKKRQRGGVHARITREEKELTWPRDKMPRRYHKDLAITIPMMRYVGVIVFGGGEWGSIHLFRSGKANHHGHYVSGDEVLSLPTIGVSRKGQVSRKKQKENTERERVESLDLSLSPVDSTGFRARDILWYYHKYDSSGPWYSFSFQEEVKIYLEEP